MAIDTQQRAAIQRLTSETRKLLEAIVELEDIAEVWVNRGYGTMVQADLDAANIPYAIADLDGIATYTLPNITKYLAGDETAATNTHRLALNKARGL